MRSPFYRSLILKYGLQNARQSFRILPTQSVITPQFAFFAAPIDHYLISPDFGVNNFKTGKNIGSDRLPIIAELLVPSKL